MWYTEPMQNRSEILHYARDELSKNHNSMKELENMGEN